MSFTDIPFDGFALARRGANNLLMIFLTVEFVSILSYLLTGFLKNDPKAKRAAVNTYSWKFLSGSCFMGCPPFERRVPSASHRSDMP